MRNQSVRRYGQKSNEVFRHGPNYDLNACVGFNGGRPTFERYADGYFEAAIRLVDSLEENSRHIDTVIYPLVNTFRHGIEVYLKHFARVMPKLYEDTSKPVLTHNLKDNWETVKPLMRKAFEGSPDYLESELKFDFILNCILEIDPNGSQFRYPESIPDRKTKKVDWHLADWSLINVSVLGGYIREAHGILETWSSCVSAHEDYYQEMLANLPNESYW